MTIANKIQPAAQNRPPSTKRNSLRQFCYDLGRLRRSDLAVQHFDLKLEALNLEWQKHRAESKNKEKLFAALAGCASQDKNPDS